MSKAFGGLVAVSGVSIAVAPQSIVSIIGPNGAGKTTFFNMLTGLYKPTAGRITFDGKDVTGRRPDIITSLGIARTFQNIRLFSTMTALENVMVGRAPADARGPVRLDPPHAGRPPRGARGARAGARDARLRRAEHGPRGHARRRTCPTATSAGWRSPARSPPSPKLLLLDEPTAGMNPQESARLTEFMERLRGERDLTILLIEHDMKVVMGVSEHITVLDHGEKIAEGAPQEIRHNERVIEAYLGKQGG